MMLTFEIGDRGNEISKGMNIRRTAEACCITEREFCRRWENSIIPDGKTIPGKKSFER